MVGGAAGYQAVADIKNLIAQNWGGAASGIGNAPLIVSEWEEKTLDYNNYEYILVKYDVEIINSFSLWDTDWKHDVPMTLDIRTSASSDRLTLLVDEVVRILKRNVRLAGYMIQLPKKTKNLFEEYRNIWRNIIDVEVTKINP